MLLHEVGRRHEWVPGHRWDLVLLVDDATNRVCAGVFASEPGFWPRVQGVRDTVAQMGLFDSLASGRSSAYWYRGLGARRRLRVQRQFIRVMHELGIEFNPRCSPQSAGSSARILRTLGDRLPRELAVASVSSMAEANEFLRQYWPIFNAEFAVEARGSSAFFRLVLDWRKVEDRVFCWKEEATIGYLGRVAHRGETLKISAKSPPITDPVQVHEYADGTLAVYQGTNRLGVYDCNGQLMEGVE